MGLILINSKIYVRLSLSLILCWSLVQLSLSLLFSWSQVLIWLFYILTEPINLLIFMGSLVPVFLFHRVWYLMFQFCVFFWQKISKLSDRMFLKYSEQNFACQDGSTWTEHRGFLEDLHAWPGDYGGVDDEHRREEV